MHDATLVSSFAADASETLQQLRTAVLDIFESSPGGIGRSRDAQRQLGINAKLSWQLFRLAAPGDPLTLAPNVPAPSAMRSLLAAAAERDVPAELVDRLARAYRAFEQLVETHAGDRASFDSMVRSVTPADTDRGDLQHRRNMFRACSHYWGLQVETYFTLHALFPSKSPDLFDYASVRCHLGLRRLRADASVIVDSFQLSMADGSKPHSFVRKPLDEDAFAQYGAPLLPEFCTQPLPQLRTHVEKNQTSCSELLNHAIGRSGAVDLTFGELTVAAPLSVGSNGHGRGFGNNVRIGAPTVTMISDMLVHRPTLPFLRPFLKVYGSTPRDSAESLLNSSQLPFNEPVRRLERGPLHAKTPQVPRYAELATDLAHRLNLSLEDFDVYRVEIAYPLMQTRIAIGFDVPEH
jgi:hypothetical protein